LLDILINHEKSNHKGLDCPLEVMASASPSYLKEVELIKCHFQKIFNLLALRIASEF